MLNHCLAVAMLVSSLLPYPADYIRRIGAAFDYFWTGDAITDYAIDTLGIGWYYNFDFTAQPSAPPNAVYVATVYAPVNGYKTATAQFAQAHPGLLWFIGNEPDNGGQTNMTPQAYAIGYHDYYALLKAADPTAQVAIGGVTQPSLLRIRYLETVLKAYTLLYGAPMPIDVWTIHGYIMPENCSSGAGYPVGISDFSGAQGCEYWPKHGDLATFKAQLINFRQWLKAQGYGDKPLIVSEFGILLSAAFGYDGNRVATYMLQAMDWMLTYGDCAIGLLADDCRLVQQFAWFSVNFDATNGELFTNDGAPSVIGQRLQVYTTGIGERFQWTPTPTVTPTPLPTLTPTATPIPTPTLTATATVLPVQTIPPVATALPTATLMADGDLSTPDPGPLPTPTALLTTTPERGVLDDLPATPSATSAPDTSLAPTPTAGPLNPLWHIYLSVIYN